MAMQDLTRRKFLKKSAAAGVAIGCGALLPPWLWAAEEEATVLPAIAQVKGPTAEAVREAVDLLGGMKAFVDEGQRVLLKPNASFSAPPEWGATTSSQVLRAVAELCLEAGAEGVVVFDHPLSSPKLCLEQTGFEGALADLDPVKLILATRRQYFEPLDVAGGRALQQIEVAKEALRADVIINLPVAKSHSATGVSFGMKNLMGLIWDRSYFHRATELHRAIAELSTVVRPDLIIVDATRALVTGGPGGPGKVLELDTIVAGTDPVAVDAHVVRMAPWLNRSMTADQVAHIAAAHSIGLGRMDEEEIQLREIDLG
jgi:uncharacterized protein (DUF362 family)